MNKIILSIGIATIATSLYSDSIIDPNNKVKSALTATTQEYDLGTRQYIDLPVYSVRCAFERGSYALRIQTNNKGVKEVKSGIKGGPTIAFEELNDENVCNFCNLVGKALVISDFDPNPKAVKIFKSGKILPHQVVDEVVCSRSN